jgi:hypothetical protein
MKMKLISSLALVLVLGGVPILAGCDKTKSEHEVEVTHPDGTKDTHVDKTVQKPDGSTETKSETSTSKPAYP